MKKSFKDDMNTHTHICIYGLFHLSVPEWAQLFESLTKRNHSTPCLAQPFSAGLTTAAEHQHFENGAPGMVTIENLVELCRLRVREKTTEL